MENAAALLHRRARSVCERDSIPTAELDAAALVRGFDVTLNAAPISELVRIDLQVLTGTVAVRAQY